MGYFHTSSTLNRAKKNAIIATKYAGFGHHLVTLSKQQIVSFEKV